jgi:hypothetical protein
LELRAITPREASIYACLVDAFCAPAGDLPPVRDTSAVEFFDEWIGSGPALNRAGVRTLLYICELGPLLSGFGHRLRRLDRDERQEYLRRIARSPAPALKAASELLRAAASLGYYGDSAVMRTVGYDPDEKLRASRELRQREGRP